MEKAGLKASERDENSDTVEKGRVISVSPAEGQRVDKGSSATLVVSTGKPQAQVPDVVGRSFDEASSTLQAAGFKVTRTDKESTDKDPGTVLDQTPKSGTTTDTGTVIALTVAKAPSQVAVPDVTGEDQAAAIAALSGQGFVIDQQSKDVPTPDGDGVVLEQSPTGGKKAKKGSKVTIVVGKFNPEPQSGRRDDHGRHDHGRHDEHGDDPVRVAVLAGGRSSEHEVSLESAASVREGLTAAGHDVLWVDLGRDGSWSCEGEEVALRAGGGLLDADAVFPALHGPFGEDGSVQGTARGARRPLRRLGRAGERRCAWTRSSSRTSWAARACRRSPTGRWTPPRAWPWPIRRR